MSTSITRPCWLVTVPVTDAVCSDGGDAYAFLALLRTGIGDDSREPSC